MKTYILVRIIFCLALSDINYTPRHSPHSTIEPCITMMALLHIGDTVSVCQ